MASHATIPRGTLKAVVRAPRCHEGDPLEMPLVHPLHQNPRGGIGASTISAVGTRACTAVATPVMAVPSPPLAPALASDAEHFCSGNGGAVSVPSVAGGDRQKWQLVLQQWPTHHFDDGVNCAVRICTRHVSSVDANSNVDSSFLSVPYTAPYLPYRCEFLFEH